MNKLEKILSLALLSSFALPAVSYADRDQQFRRGRGGFRGNERSERPGNFMKGQLRHGGNGCPAGTMRVVFSPDNLSFTLLFDRFVADANSNENGQRGSMSCDAILPITLPANQQMEITRVDYRGFVSVPARGQGTLQSMFNFVENDRNNRRWKDRDRINLRFKFDGPIAENYEISSGQLGEGRGVPPTEVSPCGGEAQLRIKNSVRVTAPQGQQAQLTVDSIDGQSNAIYFVSWKSCQSHGRPDPRGPHR